MGVQGRKVYDFGYRCGIVPRAEGSRSRGVCGCMFVQKTWVEENEKAPIDVKPVHVGRRQHLARNGTAIEMARLNAAETFGAGKSK